MDGVRDFGHLPGWLRPSGGEHRWPVAVAILVAVGLQSVISPALSFSPRWLLPAVELALLAILVVVNPFRLDTESRILRQVSLALVTVASLAVVWSTGRLVAALMTGVEGGGEPVTVLLGGGSIWLTNVIVFAVWFWELDRGGPAARAHARRTHPDFLFPQMTVPHLTHDAWRPEFLDYLYVAFTTATAFSPSDTLPLSRTAKVAMLIESVVSATVLLVVIARAVGALD